MLQHNARMGKGLVATVSAIAMMPGLEQAVTPYSLLNVHPEKEDVWERTRKAHFAHLPSRQKAFFCFRTEADARRVQWFSGKDRELLRVQMTEAAQAFAADSRLLDATPDNWESAARSYWSGDLTSEPLEEVIVHGQFYMPDWQSFPWGR